MALRRKSAIWRAVPSAAFNAMLPLKPSDTMTSAAPPPIPSPSTKPIYSSSGRFIARSRPYTGNGRPVDAGHGVQMEARHRHQRAGIAGGNRHVGFALLHRVDRKPHRRVLAAAAQRLARLVVHADGHVGMDHARGLFQRRIFGKLLVDLFAVAIEQEFAVGMPFQRDGGAGNDDRCADIATHGVKRDSNLLRHERPGNLISCGPRRARPRTGKAPPKRCSARRIPAPPPGRDNSVSPPRHNLLTTVYWRKASAVARNQEYKISRYNSISYGEFLVGYRNDLQSMGASPAT